MSAPSLRTHIATVIPVAIAILISCMTASWMTTALGQYLHDNHSDRPLPALTEFLLAHGKNASRLGLALVAAFLITSFALFRKPQTLESALRTELALACVGFTIAFLILVTTCIGFTIPFIKIVSPMGGQP